MIEPGQDVMWSDGQIYTVSSFYSDLTTGLLVPGLIIITNEFEAERVVRIDEVSPLTRSGVLQMKLKCKRGGCYNPSDCKHGYCGEHCTSVTHQLGNYSTRTYPRTSCKYMGIELEVEFNSERDLKRGVAAFGGHHDGSLGDYAAEYKMLRPITTICKYAAKLAEELWKLKAKVTKRCGFHVHIDARQIETIKLTDFYTWAYYTQDHWYKLMPSSRRTNAYVCKLTQNMPPAMIRDPGNFHHCWINHSPFSTVEVRLHNGTLNPYKIQGWLTALIHLQSKLYDPKFSFISLINLSQEENIETKAKSLFWKVFNDCPQLGLEYLETREQNEGIIRDYAFTTLHRNEEE
jgi:hypothetical protein